MTIKNPMEKSNIPSCPATRVVPEITVSKLDLPTYATNINDILIDANDLVKQAAAMYLHIGKLFLEARQVFPGDKEFGQWAQKECPGIQKRWRSSLMKTARKFGHLVTDSGQPATDSALLQLPISTLVELTPAKGATIDEVERRVGAGHNITKADARARSKADKEAVEEPKGIFAHTEAEPDKETFGGAIKKSMDPTHSKDKKTRKVPPIDIQGISLLTLSTAQRCEHTDDPFIIFGLNPFVDHPIVATDTVECIYACLMQACTTNLEREKINQAYTALKSESEVTIQAHDLGLVSYKLTKGHYEDE